MEINSQFWREDQNQGVCRVVSSEGCERRICPKPLSLAVFMFMWCFLYYTYLGPNFSFLEGHQPF
jgi:hypothetical protein